MKFSAIIFLFIFTASCTKESAEVVLILNEIIAQHYNDKLVSRNLLPARHYNNWSKGRIKTQMRNGESIKIPPPPTTDTAIYSQGYFDKLVAEKIISSFEKEALLKSLQQTNDDMLLPANKAKGVLDLKEILELQRPSENGLVNHNYYELSTPIFNAKKDLVIFLVNFRQGNASRGILVVFRLTDLGWQKVNSKTKWIV